MKFPVLALLVSMTWLLMSCVESETRLFDSDKSQEQVTESRVQVAIALLQENKPELAMLHLKEALEKDPESARAHEILALTLERLGDADQVEGHFRKMIEYGETYTRGRANFGSYLMRNQRYQEAYDQFTIVLRDIYYPNRTVVYFQKADAARHMQKPQAEVEGYYLKALSINPNFYPSLLELAMVKFENGEFPASSDYLNEYRKKVSQAEPEVQSEPKALLLGIRLSRVFKNKNEEGSYAMVLRSLYPNSQEYLEYLNMIQSQ